MYMVFYQSLKIFRRNKSLICLWNLLTKNQIDGLIPNHADKISVSDNIYVIFKGIFLLLFYLHWRRYLSWNLHWQNSMHALYNWANYAITVITAYSSNVIKVKLKKACKSTKNISFSRHESEVLKAESTTAAKFK